MESIDELRLKQLQETEPNACADDIKTLDERIYQAILGPVLPEKRLTTNAERREIMAREAAALGMTDVIFDEKLQRSFPNSMTCAQTTVKRVPCDGACFFHCVIEASLRRKAQ